MRTPTTATIRPSIVLFGDSLTQFGFGQEAAGATPGLGWASLLSCTYSRRADVLTRGYSGYNTRMALDILPGVVQNCGAASAGGRTLLWTLWFGANDAALPGTRQHVPIGEYDQNVRKMIGLIRDSNAGQNTASASTSSSSSKSEDVPIILITAPPVYQPKWDEWCKANGRDKSQRTNAASREYGLTLHQIGSELNCEVLDAWKLIGGDTEGFERCLTDGLHLNAEGNKVIYDGLMELINEKFPNLAPMVDGDGRYGRVGIPTEDKLWTELC